MRIVADTNTVLSGLLWFGSPRRLLNLACKRQLTLCTSLALVAELAEVIGRPKSAQRVQAAGLSAAALVQDYARLAEIVEPHPVHASPSRDPDDDAVLGAALGARADLIVSGDDDLLSLGDYEGIPILPTAQALERIRGQEA